MTNILIVEDEPLIRMNVADALREAGFEVQAAADAGMAESLMLADVPPFDGVIVDIGLPAKPGGALARGFRARVPSPA